MTAQQKNLYAQLESNQEIKEIIVESRCPDVFEVECFICKKKVSLLNCSYLGGDPVHKGHLK